MRRQTAGAMRGINPSKTNTKARADQNRSPTNVGLHLATLLLRMALKKSDDGSKTITSDLLPKLDL